MDSELTGALQPAVCIGVLDCEIFNMFEPSSSPSNVSAWCAAWMEVNSTQAKRPLFLTARTYSQFDCVKCKLQKQLKADDVKSSPARAYLQQLRLPLQHSGRSLPTRFLTVLPSADLRHELCAVPCLGHLIEQHQDLHRP